MSDVTPSRARWTTGARLASEHDDLVMMAGCSHNVAAQGTHQPCAAVLLMVLLANWGAGYGGVAVLSQT